jgi:hypothetical protein
MYGRHLPRRAGGALGRRQAFDHHFDRFFAQLLRDLVAPQLARREATEEQRTLRHHAHCF